MISFLSLPQQCVYGVFDESRNMFSIGYTQSMARTLGELYTLYQGSPGYQLRVLTETGDSQHLKLYTEYYRDRYRAMGWVELGSPGRKTVQYRVRCMVAPNFKSVRVELVMARGDVDRVVGVFKTDGEARDFIETCYGTDNSNCFPVYAANSLTKEFLHKEQTKLLDI